MDGLGAGLLAGGDDLVGDEVGLRWPAAGPMNTASSAISTAIAVGVGLGVDDDRGLIPIRRQVLMTRTAISPRLAIKIFENMRRTFENP